jgi:transcription antitermination factor NusG
MHVYRCGSLRELAQHSQAGHCVAFALRPCDSASLKTGDLVRITSGPLQDADAIIVDVDAAKDMAEVMIDVRGRVSPIWMKYDELAVVTDEDGT